MREGHDLTARIRWGHESEVERLTFMEANGHLTDAERRRITERCAAAKARIAAGRERKEALGYGYGGDRLRIVAEAVEAAT